MLGLFRKKKSRTQQKKFNIIVLQNEKSDAESIKKIFTARINYSLDITTDSMECFTKMRSKHYDILIMEYHLSGSFDGKYVIERTRILHSDTKILLITSDKTVPFSKLPIDGYYIAGGLWAEFVATVDELLYKE